VSHPSLSRPLPTPGGGGLPSLTHHTGEGCLHVVAREGQLSKPSCHFPASLLREAVSHDPSSEEMASFDDRWIMSALEEGGAGLGVLSGISVA
jgi:hypothetical protein